MRVWRLLGSAAAILIVGRIALRDRLQPIGGHWAVGRPPLFRGNRMLYRVGEHPFLSRTRVDREIQLIRFYPPDCVLYTTRRSYDGKVIYAVCGDRTPVSVATRDYRMDEFGLEWRHPPDVVDGRPFMNGMRIPIGRIKAVAKKASSFDPDFELTFNKYSRHVEPIPFHVPIDAEEPDDRESTLLHDVVASGNYARVLSLLSEGLHPDVRGPTGVTPLMIATFDDKPASSAIVAALLSAGADPDAQSKTGMTALMFAVRAGSVNAVQLLRNADADTTLRDRGGRRASDMMAVRTSQP